MRDIQGAVLQAIAYTGPLTELRYVDLRQALRAVLKDDPPSQQEVTRVLHLPCRRCGRQLVPVMTKAGNEHTVGEAGLLILASIGDFARRARYLQGVIRTPPDVNEWILAHGIRETHGFVKGALSNFLHLAAGEKFKRFGRGWKKAR